jgi:hypothetical protein
LQQARLHLNHARRGVVQTSTFTAQLAIVGRMGWVADNISDFALLSFD